MKSFISKIASAKDEKTIATHSTNGETKIWDTKTWKCLNTQISHPNTLMLYDGDIVVIGGSKEHGVVTLYNAKTFERFNSFMVGYEVTKGHTIYWFDSSIDIKKLLNGSFLVAVGTEHGLIMITECKQASNEMVNTDMGGYYTYGYAKDYKTIAFIGDKENGSRFDSITDLHFSPNGEFLASISFSKGMQIYDTKKWECIKALPNVGLHMAYSPDGSTIASGDGQKVIIWDVTTLECVATLKEGLRESIRCIAYSPDGSTIASGDTTSCWNKSQKSQNTVVIWSTKTWKCLQKLEHGDSITSITYPNSITLITGSEDETVSVWKLKNDKFFLSKNLFGNPALYPNPNSPKHEEDMKMLNLVISPQVNNNSLGNNDQTNQKTNQQKYELTKSDPSVSIDSYCCFGTKKTYSDGRIENKCVIFTVDKIKYDNPLLNHPELLKVLVSSLNLSLSKVLDVSSYLTNLFGSQDFEQICNNDTSLLYELIGNTIDCDTTNYY